MRDSNYKSVSLNKAAVSITTNLYDRRALDATCDRPLVNSLNHLTFLTSSSAKVRETLATDGGLERLVCILHECHKDLTREHPRDKLGRKTIAEEKDDALIAWKWTLAFQCLVLIGTRGTEKIRERVVQAGVVPIIATVLDNYLLASRNFDSTEDTTLCENFVTLVQSQVIKMKRDQEETQSDLKKDRIEDTDDGSTVIANYLSANSELLQYLSESNDTSGSSSPQVIDGAPLSPITELNIQQNLHDINHTITSPRFFLRGVLIPKEDDVVWSLQLLAFISKYSSLKKHLQSTYLVEHLSLRALLQGDQCCPEGEMRPPALDTDNDGDNDAEMELISNLSADESEQTSHTQSLLLQHSQHTQPASQRLTHSQPSQPSSQMEPHSQPNAPGVLIQVNSSSEELNNNNNNNQQEGKSAELLDLNARLISQPPLTPSTVAEPKSKCCLSKSLLHSLMKFESCSKGQSREEKTISLIELTVKLNNFYGEKSILSKILKINKCRAEKEEYRAKWNYETYFQQHSPGSDLDLSNSNKHEINVFPLVEKFTVKATNSTDMCYWSGVIMRNSCRKAESGVRQCACFDCGRWEKYPRQFAKCRRCKRTKYCSKECQLRAWGYHKHWCLDSATASSSQSQPPSQQEPQAPAREELRFADAL